ncbi:MAG: hypothetical protein HY554_11485 [Elusimicrobia bacterium]|nr:hypothetical protein [Elusimicrobiota bacterium]
MKDRGVVLIHVLILMALMGFIASLILKATLSRHMSSQKSIASDENRAAMEGASAIVTSCLLASGLNYPARDPDCVATPGPPAVTCASDCTTAPSNLSSCVPAEQKIGNRFFKYRLCDAPAGVSPAPTCRIVINVCKAESLGDCLAPDCPAS